MLKRALFSAAGVTVMMLGVGGGGNGGRAQSTSVEFSEVLVVGGLSSPTAMEYAPDGRLFVAEQSGRLRVVQDGQLLSTPFYTATVATTGEQGLLGIAFDPGFSVNQYVYIYYTASGSSAHNRISRLTANGNVAVNGSEVALLDLPGIGTIAHQGGAIHFGLDGKLYVAVGDHQTPENSQPLTSVFGKLLRINADGTIPPDNPFYGQTSGINRAIYARGFRNPFTFAVDSGTGRIFVNDVGEATWEEINQLASGANYGWPICEGPFGSGVGSCNDPSLTYPVHAYAHSGGEGAVTGGVFYRGTQFPGSYFGAYFFADYTRGWIRYLNAANQAPGMNNPSTDFRTAQWPVDLKVGPDGALYYLSIGAGSVYKIEYVSSNLNPTGVISATPTAGTPPLLVTFDGSGSSDPDGDPLTYTWNFGDGSAPAVGVNVAHTYLADGPYLASLTVNDGRGGSGNATATIRVGTPPVASITSPAPGARYNAGNTIFYAGNGMDAEDGIMSASTLSWTIVFHHELHTHPFLGPINGVSGGSFQIPQIGETSVNVSYRIHLTATDSSGLSHEVTRDVLPNVVSFAVTSNVAGISLTLDGQPLGAPVAAQGVVGLLRSIGAPSPQTIAGTTYAFLSWSDGGAATHTITTPSVATTYTAVYQPPPSDITPPVISSVVSSSVTGSSVVIGWTTNEPADGRVEYGTTAVYGNTSSLNAVLATTHSQTLTGLAPNTSYHYRVHSRDAAGNASVSSDSTFMTLPLPSLGLVGLWSFDENGGTLAHDGSGAGNNGTLTNGPVWVSANCKVNGCLQFSGNNDYVRVPSSSSLQIVANLTVSLWIKPILGTRQVTLSKGGVEYEIGYIEETPPYRLRWSQKSGSGLLVSALDNNQWQHIVLMRDALKKQIRGYKNGILSLTSNYARAPTSSLNLLSIGRGNSAAQAFKGQMDEVRIYNVVLSDADVQTLFNQR